MRIHLALFAVLTALPACVSSVGECRQDSASARLYGTTRPLLALWRESEGNVVDPIGAPNLRFAIWRDGSVLFAADPQRWDSELREGRIEPDRLAPLLQAVRATRVLELKPVESVAFDSETDCLLLDLGDRWQRLDSDEGDRSDWGPEFVHQRECWKEVNRLVLAELPSASEPATATFRGVPESWYVEHLVGRAIGRPGPDECDRQVLEAALLDLLRAEPTCSPTTFTPPRKLVLHAGLPPSFGLCLAPQRGPSFLDDAFDDVMLRGETARANDASSTPYAGLEFDPRIRVADLREPVVDPAHPSIEGQDPRAAAWAKAWLPGYSADGTHALVCVELGPELVSATVWLVRVHDGWIPIGHALSFYAVEI